MKILKLEDAEEVLAIYINAEHIQAVFKNRRGFTRINMSSGQFHTVEQSVETVVKLMGEVSP